MIAITTNNSTSVKPESLAPPSLTLLILIGNLFSTRGNRRALQNIKRKIVAPFRRRRRASFLTPKSSRSSETPSKSSPRSSRTPLCLLAKTRIGEKRRNAVAAVRPRRRFALRKRFKSSKRFNAGPDRSRSRLSPRYSLFIYREKEKSITADVSTRNVSTFSAASEAAKSLPVLQSRAVERLKVNRFKRVLFLSVK